MISSFLFFLVFLSILILIHELGHYLAARIAGVWVEEFGLGMPPRLFGKKIGETLYSVNLLPFGGFVRLHGENTEESINKPKRAFLKRSKKVRAAITVAGVIMNFALAIFAFSVSYSYTGIPRKTGEITIVDVRENTPAVEAGFELDDVVLEIDDNKVYDNDEFLDYVGGKKGSEVEFLVKRGEERVEIRATPRLEYPENEGALGVMITDSEIYKPVLWKRPFLGVYYGFQEAIYWGSIVLQSFASIISDLFSGMLPQGVAGPAGLFVITNEVAKFGFIPLLNWMGIISVNLAILNIFPFPALDGGRLLFIGIEKLFGRKILPKVENWLNMFSLGLLMLFLLAVTAREIRLIYKLGFSGYLDFLSSGQGLR